MTRLALYCFYEKDGIVDDYVFFYLEELKKVANEIYVIVNGSLDEKYLPKLEGICKHVWIRENQGLDAYAFKYALENIQDVSNYDELILSNNSFFGPLFPLSQMFDDMYKHKGDLDFWGTTIHPKVDMIISKKQLHNYVNEHIQSFFVVFKKNVFTSPIFINFFKKLPKISCFTDAVVLFDLRLTEVLSSAGYKYGAYCETYKHSTFNSSILQPYELVTKWNMPFIKKKVFFENYF